jgi:hypothetical protein
MYILNHIFFVDVGEISSNYRSLRQYMGAIMPIFETIYCRCRENMSGC